MRGRGWPRRLGAAGAGLGLGVSGLSAGALLLYGQEGFLSSAGFLLALATVAVAAGLWVGAPDGPAPGHRRMLGRWMFAVGSLVMVSFVAMVWLRSPRLQTSPYGLPLAALLLLGEPAYALGSLLAALEARQRRWLGARWYAVHEPGSAGSAGVAVPGLLGLAGGVVLAGAWLIPSFPPGPVFLGTGLLLALAGSVEMGLAGEPKEGRMAERVVIVTGVGAPGQVGHAVASAFAEAGARLLVTGRSADVAERARELGADVLAVEADLSDPAQVEEVVEAARARWGRLDVLVNVAGGLRVMKPLADTSADDWEREHTANARTAFLMSRAALPLLRESRGCIVNFASPAGERAVKGLGAYSAAKAGVVALTRALALEEQDGGVRVNAVAPGMVDTEQNRDAVTDPSTVRWVTRSEVVEAVLFLASDRGSGVTGEVLHVPGRGLR